MTGLEMLFAALAGGLFIGHLWVYRFRLQAKHELIAADSMIKDLQQRLQDQEQVEQAQAQELRHLQAQRAELQATLTEREASFSRERKLAEEQRQQLENSFSHLARQALEANVEQFLKLATERLDRKSLEHNSSLKEKSEEFLKMVGPIRELMDRIDQDFDKVEKARIEQFSQIQEQLRSMQTASESLRKEASSLSSALRRPEVRGSWGEIQLRRVVELAGMSAHCDFEEQVSVRKDEGLQKPDMLIHLPNRRNIVVDSKAVLDAYLDAAEASKEEERKAALDRHAKNLRSRVRELAKKSYWEQFEASPDFVVLFVPNEALLQAAVEVDRALMEDALVDRIIIATPTTLVALLKAVAYGWQQDLVAQNTQQMVRSAKELYERVGKWSKLMLDVGNRLQATTKSYNEAVGSLQSRVLPAARRMKDFGLQELGEIPEIPTVDVTCRELKDAEEANFER